MKKRVLNCFNGRVEFVADVGQSVDKRDSNGDCILWAIENNRPVSGCLLSGSSLKSQDLSSVVFDGSMMASSRFNSCNLSGASFKRCDMVDAVFEDCNLSGCDFSSANIKHARFIRCNISDANFYGCNIHYIDFENTDISVADFSEVNGISDHIKCMQVLGAPIVWTDQHIYIGKNKGLIADVEIQGPSVGDDDGGEVGERFWLENSKKIMQIIKSIPAERVDSKRRSVPRRQI